MGCKSTIMGINHNYIRNHQRVLQFSSFPLFPLDPLTTVNGCLAFARSASTLWLFCCRKLSKADVAAWRAVPHLTCISYGKKCYDTIYLKLAAHICIYLYLYLSTYLPTYYSIYLSFDLSMCNPRNSWLPWFNWTLLIWLVVEPPSPVKRR